MNDLDDLYREIILDHYKNPRNQGVLEGPTVHAEEGFNPLCGDEVKVYVQVEDGVVHDIKITGQGCSISRSSASLMSQAVKGQSLDEVKATVSRFKRMIAVEETEDEPEPVDLRVIGELAALQGVVKFPVRIKCATLAWNTLMLALDEESHSV
ncbi:Fe-S cluster assembly sulfur transfer protein SufU [Ferrimicrobium sp.]|uniref:Fe-S cluster assembly sulfur transfer protein SufU n=1 Tax=Ferrimicrobium sp. TaxID=2926050 RepID=UPI00262D5265|nr:SUF system NifU family Fe-S cluster assembly protein [Ferrimicrobium sp.]